MNTKLRNESDVLAENEMLKLQARYLRAKVELQTGESVPAPAPTGDDIIGYGETLTAHIADLEAKLSATPSQEAEAPGNREASQGRTLTEQCRDAKANPRRTPAKYTGITARCLAAKTQPTEDTENHTH